MRLLTAQVCLISLLLSACCMKISHSDGSVTYLGAVNIQEGNTADAPLVHSRRYGLMLDAGATANGLALGYDNRLIVKPPTDKITQIDYTPATTPFLTRADDPPNRHFRLCPQHPP